MHFTTFKKSRCYMPLNNSLAGALELKDVNVILTFHQRYHWHRLSTPVSHPQGTNWCCGAWFSRSRAKACTRSLGPGPDGSSGTLLEGAHSILVLRQAYSKPLETNAHDGTNYLKKKHLSSKQPSILKSLNKLYP